MEMNAVKNGSFARRALIAVCAASAAAAVLTPVASASVYDPSTCANPQLSQNFLSWKDQNWYTPIPGQSNAGFDGTGWTLTGGARLVTSTLPDGATRQVLDLPSGSKAVSPVSCITSDYPTFRTFVRDVVGSEGVFFYVSYAGASSWSNLKNTGQFHGNGTAWSLSGSVNLQPTKTSGWQPVQITFIPGGKTSDFQVYDAELDPRMKS
jgi:hypothetical protein